MVGSAASAAAGIEEVRRLKPDILLLDVNLGDLDGIAATSKVIREEPLVSVILISVQNDREYLRRAMQAGAREYLIKPFSADELVAAVRRVYGIDQSKLGAATAEPPQDAKPSPPAAPPPAPPPAPPSRSRTAPVAPEPEVETPPPARAPARPRADWEPVPAAPAPPPPEPPTSPPGVTPAAPGPPPLQESQPEPEPGLPEPEPEPIAIPIAGAPPAAPVQPALEPGTPAPVILGPEDSIGGGPLTVMLPAQGHTPAMKRKSQIGEVTAVYSGKGGVGKTTIAVNLATALVKELSEDVALVDLDLQFGDTAVLLGLDPPGSMADLARAYPDVDAPLLGSFMPAAPGGVRVLSSPLSPELADLIRPEHVRMALELLKAAFDHVIVDMAPHLNDVSLEALEVADRVLVITDLNVPAIKDAKLAFKLFEHLGIARERIHLVLNRSDSPSNVTVAQLEANLRCPVAVAIPSEGKIVLQSLQKGVPFVTLFPDSEISRKVRELVGSLVPLADAKRPGSRKAGRRKFWARSGAS